MSDDDDQLNLFGENDRPKDDDDDFILQARHGDPETSHEAMEDYDKAKMSEASACVVRIYQEHGPLADFQLKPIFDSEWGHDCSFHLYRQARSVARDLGKIVDSGERLLNPETNRLQIIWEFATGKPIKIHKCPTCGHVLRRETEMKNGQHNPD